MRWRPGSRSSTSRRNPPSEIVFPVRWRCGARRPPRGAHRISTSANPLASWDLLSFVPGGDMGHEDRTEAFYPTGAIAFFAAMTVFFAVVWLALYALMIYRH